MSTRVFRQLAGSVRSIARRQRAASAALAVALLLPPLDSAADSTSRFAIDGYDQFDEGETEDAFISSAGEVRPGWGSSSLTLETGGIWSAVRAKDGTVYLGTADEGAIWRVKGKVAKKLATAKGAVAVVSLVMSGNTLYAGTMPGGEVWAIDTTSGNARKLVALDDVETVWSLAVDRAGHLFAGTGPIGTLFRIDTKSGKAKRVFESGDKRILSMLATSDGAVWFGTSEEALLFRHDPAKGITRAMADFSGNEVTALAEHKGSVIAAANTLTAPTTSGVKTAAAVKAAEGKQEAGEKGKSTKSPADKRTKSGTEPARKGERKGKGVLFRVRGDGQLEQLHTLAHTYFNAVAVAPSGQILAGSADKGRVYLIDADDSVSTAFDVTQRQIVQILPDASGGISFVTDDGAALYRTTGRASRATYTSKVFDADAPARFGSLSWRASGKVQVETRSGNTEEPGPGWSKWQAPREVHAAGGGASRAKVTSPSGRYLQVRVRLASDDAVLRWAQAYYLAQNRPTRVEEITVAAKDDSSDLLEHSTSPRSPILKLSWKVDNEDGDKSVYKLAVRREGDVRWRSVHTGTKPLTATSYEWNSETYPDGYYRLRVTASDSLENAAGRALDASRISSVFAVDNQRPTLSAITVRYPSVSLRATDAISPLKQMAWSVDEGPWHLGATRDGLFDDTTETLIIKLPDDLSPGAHTLAIRVIDEAGNIGSESVTFEVN